MADEPAPAPPTPAGTPEAPPPVAVPTVLGFLVDIFRLAVAVGVGYAAYHGAFALGFDARWSAVAAIALGIGAHAATRFLVRESPAAGKAPAHEADSVREVVETVVFVVVLVLLLKSFAAEAFVIPTGSMAETLYGYQKIVKCPRCEYEFPVNCSSEVDPSEGRTVPVFACTCPNCMQNIHWDVFFNGKNFLPFDYAERHPDSVKVPSPGWNSGDRVLVDKAVYDLPGRPPERLDVVVFKYPGDRDFPRTGPYKGHSPMNYIKRLVGLPGETIAIHAGDLYRLPPDQSPRYDDLSELPEGERRDDARKLLWRARNMHADDPAALDRFRKGEFEIIRKPPAQVLAMRRIVYDNDHPAKDLEGVLPPRWAGSAAWAPAPDRGYSATPAGDGSVHWLRYRHILRGRGGKPQLVTDFMGYNTWDNDAHHRGHPGENWVGDLSLDCEVRIDQPEGELVLELVKSVDRFQARFDLAAGTCTLLRLGGGKEATLATAPAGVRAGTYRLRFANVDERLTVWVNDQLPFGDGVSYPPPVRIDPTHPGERERVELPTTDDLQPAAVGTRGAAVTVRHLQLWRDTYYTVEPSQADVGRVEWTDPASWADVRLPVKTLYVQPGHYLCLGDNSPESSDGRSWGLVPERLLLGRALLVYYPLGRAGRIR